jgi:cysteine sulfinate desulfinase/cysteine desulfurase-like protein
VAAASPRIILFGMWLFTDYVSSAYETWIWPLLGFFLLPTTTIAYSIAANEFGGFEGWGAVIVVAGVVIDMMIYGGLRSRD